MRGLAALHLGSPTMSPQISLIPPVRLVTGGPGVWEPPPGPSGVLILAPRDKVPRPGPHQLPPGPRPCRKERQTCLTRKPAPGPSS
jgi:hypothetical protein